MVDMKIVAFDPVKFGQAVRERRGAKSPETVCGELGTVLRVLGEVERGNIESVEVFAKFCKWLGTSADDWLNLTDNEEIAKEEGIMEKLKRLFDEVLPVTIGNIIHIKRTAGKN